MQYADFGKTGCRVSRLGFGCMRLPLTDEKVYASIDEEKACRMIRTAIDSGVNYVDTAYFYHDGESEKVVGKALKDGYREKVYLATKLPMGSVEKTEDFDRLLNDQLKKLDTDHIDFYLFHALNAERWETVKRLGLMEKMEEAKKDGRIRHCGFSFHDDLQAFERIVNEYTNCEFCQIQLNYLDTDYQAGLEGLRLASRKGLGVVVMEPLRGGMLAKDDSERMANFAPGTNAVAAALDFIWDMEEVSLLLSGMSAPEQVAENLLLADNARANSLTPAHKAQYAAAKKQYDQKGLIPCTGCQYCQPCEQGVDIPAIFEAWNLTAEHSRREVKKRMPDIEERISRCIGCGQCESKCPQQIEIISGLKRIKDSF